MRAMCRVQIKNRKRDGTQISMERAMCGVQVKDRKRSMDMMLILILNEMMD